MSSVSIIIKALDEEAHIACAIESALAALGTAEGEIILADSGSRDRTVDIARDYPIRIVQLADRAMASCGAGPQLGYQHSRGDFVCLIDGDMELDRDFLHAALAELESNPTLAAVSGAVEELNIENLEFSRRTRRKTSDLEAGDVDRLNGGGLYRRSAIEAVGYFSDRNLHGYEEFDIAVRLRTAGWRLRRLPIRFVAHRGHTIGAYALLVRRWRTGYVFGIGEVLRGALGRAHLGRLLSGLPEIRLWASVVASWAVSLLWLVMAEGGLVKVAGLGFILVLPMAVMALRYGSVALGVYSVIAWHLHAAGFLHGLLRPRMTAAEPLPSHVLQDRTVDRGIRAGEALPR